MIAYLDNSATTRPTDAVVEKMTEAMRDGYFNPSALYEPAMRAEKRLAACRDQIRAAIHGEGGTVLFTSGGTESNNLAILGSVAAMRGARHVIVTSVEHPSVLEACEALRAEGHRVTVLPVDGQGQPDWAALNRALDDAPSLVSCMQVNNETGAMPDLGRLSRAVRERAPEALLHVDGVQGFLRVPTDASLMDLYTLSGHKLHAPKGIGALWARRGVRLAPRQLGGGQEGGLRSGTENTPGVAGLSAAIAQIRAADGVESRLMEKKLLLLRLLREAIPAATVNGPAPEAAAPHILNVSFPGVRGEVMLHALEADGVYCSTGSACSSKKRRLSPVLLNMGVAPDTAECALRFSLSPYTTNEEIRYAATKAGGAYALLSRYRRR